MESRKDITHPKLRLPTWDYSVRASYFVTFCTKERGNLLGILRVSDNGCSPNVHIELTEAGKAVEQASRSAEEAYPMFKTRMLKIMPDHVHAVIDKAEDDEKKTKLGVFISCWKRMATLQSEKLREIPVFWQKGYYDHIIRDESDLERIMEYIANNPQALSLKGLFS